MPVFTGQNTLEFGGAAATAIWYCRHGCESTLLDAPQTTNILILTLFVVTAGAKAVRTIDRMNFWFAMSRKGFEKRGLL